MSKAGKVGMIVAAVLVILGLLLFVGAMAVYRWNFTQLGTAAYTTNTYTVNEDFDAIMVDVSTTDITFLPAEDDICSVVCFETEKLRHSAVVQDGMLVIGTIDTRKWYDHIGIFMQTPQMTVYLPQDTYTALQIETDTGDITIPQHFSFQNITVQGATADVHCFAPVTGTVQVAVSTGDIMLENIAAGRLHLTTHTGGITIHAVSVETDVELETDTGKVKLTDVTCGGVIAESSTGDMEFNGVVALGGLSLESDTGDITFENSDAAEIVVHTDTGDVSGVLLSDKVFITESSTGDIRVPQTVSGGKCEITTDTGDVNIRISS